MKKTLGCKIATATLSALLPILLLAGCGASSAPVKEITAGGTSAVQSTAESTAATDGAAAGDEAITETVLYQGSDITITATGIANDAIWGKGMNLLIENSGAQNLTVQCNTLVVNNYMIEVPMLSCDVAAGKKANDVLYVLDSTMEKAGLTTIGEIDVSFNIIDSTSYTTLETTPETALQTSAYGTTSDPDTSGGTELYNADGVRIVGKYVDENSFWGMGIELYIENTSGRDVLVQCDDMSVNGFMVTPFFSCRVNDTRKALTAITLMSSDLEANGITTLESAELVFNIADPETYMNITTSGPVTFNA